MERSKLSRKERDKLRHKEEILEAALLLFSGKGFHNVSMQEIAEQSEFGVGTLYKFFESKDTLFEELMKNAANHVMDIISKILDGPGNAEERLAAFIRHQPDFQEQHGELIKLYVSEFGIKGSKLSKIHNESGVSKVISSKLARLIEEGINEGLFRSVDPSIAAKSLEATVETLIFETSGNFDRKKATEKFEKVEKLFLDGLLIPGGQNDEQHD